MKKRETFGRSVDPWLVGRLLETGLTGARHEFGFFPLIRPFTENQSARELG